jgi:polysaccharide pyruvyl transferase WcaK-like protein
MKLEEKPKKIFFFGHFDSTNFGNESTLQAILYHLRCFQPNAEITCISTGPEATAAIHHIKAVPLAEAFLRPSSSRNPVLRAIRMVFIGVPSELYRLIKGIRMLKGTDMLIIPGTGLLTDAYGLLGWGPYTLLKWSLIARICRCKILFVSIGAGPIYGTLGRYFVRTILSLADFRSYRDDSTKVYLKGIGFPADKDPIYPDLAFSLPESVIPHGPTPKHSRCVVGLGVMAYAGSYSVVKNDTTYTKYMETLVALAAWLIAHDYDIRLLSGDIADTNAREMFCDLLKKRLSPHDKEQRGHVFNESIHSVEDLFSQISATDFVVATRFHNALFALLCNKPAISISFHHKCDSLMSAMGISEYSLDINELKADGMVEKFCDLETNAARIRPLIEARAKEFRQALDEQYKLIFNEL